MPNPRPVFRAATAALALVCLGAAAPPPSSGQQLKASVKVILERLPLEKQKRLENLALDIETYVNDYDWTGGNTDWELPLNIQIYLQDISASFEDRYAGTFLISNTTDLQYFDKYWRFPHQAGDRLMHDESVYLPFTGFIDIYENLVLAAENDKYAAQGGAPYYERAKVLSDQARFNTQFMLGWDERIRLLQTLMGQENAGFRKAKFLLFSSFAAAEAGDTTAVPMGRQAVDAIDGVLKRNPDHKEALDLLKTHHVDIAELFRGDGAALERMKTLDAEHAETYQRIIDE
jgi:hypothetical protein